MKTLFILLGVFAITPFLYAQDAELEKYQAKLISAGKLNNKDSIAAAYSELSEYYSNRSVDSCRYYAEKGLEILQTKNSPLYASLLCNLGDAYFSSGNLDKAFHYFSMAHDEAARQRDTALWATVSANLGVVCRQKKDWTPRLFIITRLWTCLKGANTIPSRRRFCAVLPFCMPIKVVWMRESLMVNVLLRRRQKVRIWI